ncbi:hypothetical protein CRM22_003213 [Opisthorchis felineus]|uniref:Uncharacterized protein n=1 Tax=Opisthorchis felineus TaxID=147828 RepID=A0A4S2M2C1_OPIFE|nr:hypothetical protein CRM22_003213 [Opisthorchis felineus]
MYFFLIHPVCPPLEKYLNFDWISICHLSSSIPSLVPTDKPVVVHRPPLLQPYCAPHLCDLTERWQSSYLCNIVNIPPAFVYLALEHIINLSQLILVSMIFFVPHVSI